MSLAFFLSARKRGGRVLTPNEVQRIDSTNEPPKRLAGEIAKAIFYLHPGFFTYAGDTIQADFIDVLIHRDVDGVTDSERAHS